MAEHAHCTASWPGCERPCLPSEKRKRWREAVRGAGAGLEGRPGGARPRPSRLQEDMSWRRSYSYVRAVPRTDPQAPVRAPSPPYRGAPSSYSRATSPPARHASPPTAEAPSPKQGIKEMTEPFWVKVRHELVDSHLIWISTELAHWADSVSESRCP